MDIDQIKCSLEFLNTNLEYVYTFVRYQVERLGQRNKSFEPYSSCFISDKDVESILKEPFGVPAWAIGTPPLRSEASPEQTPELARIVDRIRSLRAEAKKKGYTLYLDKVCTDFSLCEKELNLLLLCVLAELDKGFEKIIGYFHNDMSNRELTTGLALDLLCSDYSDKIEMRKRMSQQGMLFKYGILRLNSRIGDDAGKWVSRHIAIENDIVLFLTGRHINTHDEEGRFLKGISFENEVSIGGQKSFLKNITFHRNNQSSDFEEPIVIILGRSGSGRLAIANWICQKEGRNIIVAKGDSNPLQKQELSEPALSRLIRDAVLYDSAIYWPNGDDLFKAENESVLKEIYQLSQKVGIRNIFANETEQTWNHHTFPVPPKVLRIPETNKTERVEIIGKLLDYDDVPSHVIEEISEVYRFERGQLPQVISVARKIAGDITGEENAINKTHLVSACRNQSNKALNQLAQLIIPKFDWRDIVLPDDNIKQLKEITNTVLFQRQVFERWGFGRKMSLARVYRIECVTIRT